MKVYSIFLNEVYKDLKGMPKEECKLDCYISTFNLDGLESAARGSVLICPGGGYRFVSQREAEPIALEFAARGYNAYVLTYSTVDRSEARFPVQLLQGWAALRYIYEMRDEHRSDTERIFVCGFSAGGHLACSIGTLWDIAEVNEVFGKNRGYGVSRMILGYSVISAKQSPHSASFENLSGSQNPENWEGLSLENRVSASTPPAFLWHTSTDNGVDVRNSLAFGAALRENGVPFEMHIFPVGPHGLSLANEITCCNRTGGILPDCAEWVGLADRFLKKKL